MTNKDDVMHQGKTISQWEKDFKGEFTYDQLLKMAKGGCDLQKILMLGLDEAEHLTSEDFNPKITLDDGIPGEVSENDLDINVSSSPTIEFKVCDKTGKVVSSNVLDHKDISSISLEYLSNCIEDMNDAAKAFPNSSFQTSMIYVDGQPLSGIKSVRDAQLRRLFASLNEIDLSDEAAALSEGALKEDVNVTVGDFKGNLARSLAKDSDKIMFRVNKKPYEIFDIHSKGGTTVVDLVQEIISESIGIDMVNSVADLIDAINDVTAGNNNSTGIEIVDDSGRNYDINDISTGRGTLRIGISEISNINESDDPDDINGNDSFPSTWIASIKLSDGKTTDIIIYGNNEDEAIAEAKDFIKTHKIENAKVLSVHPKKLNEGYNWRNGGYGGTGRSYRSFGEFGAPRGKAISWFSISELDPKAKGKMLDWRAGPSNFPFKDLLYPERKYKVGTTVMRSKFLKAGDESGVKYIAIPSYLDAIWKNDEEAINLLKVLGIPLDLTFGYNRGDDFSSTYTIQQVNESKTCKIVFNQKTGEWEGFADGQLLASAKETRDCCDQMFKLGYNIQDVDTSSDPELAAAIQKNGND